MIPMLAKKQYLKNYAFVQAKLERLCRMQQMNTDRNGHYETAIHEVIRLRDGIEAAVENMEDESEKEVLAQKYLCGKSFSDCAESMHYSQRQIERIHKKALEHFSPSPEQLGAFRIPS